MEEKLDNAKKLDYSYETIIDLQFKMQKFQSDLENLHEKIDGKTRLPLSHQLADTVNGVVGLKEAITSRCRIIKYIWTFLFCLGFIGAICVIFQTADEYLKEPTVTKVSIESQGIYEYPPIVFCNDAWFDTQKALDLGLSIDGLKYSLGFTRNRPQTKLGNVTVARSNFYQIYYKRNFTSLIDYYKAISIDFTKQSSRYAVFNSTVPSYHAQTEMQKIYLPFVSVCHFLKLKPIVRANPNFAAERIHFNFIDRTQSLIPVNPFWYLYFYTDGSTLYSWPLTIPPSVGHTTLTIKEKRIISVDTGQNPCLEKRENYTASACRTVCKNRKVKEKYKCQFYFMALDNSRDGPSEFCNYFDYPPEIEFNQIKSTIDSRIDTQIDTCFKNCLPLCENIIYEASINGMEDYNYHQNAPIDKKFNSNASVTVISILHDAMQQGGILVFLQVDAYTFTSLITNIGGTLGLFIGGTLMTVPQFILFMVNLCLEKRKTNDNKDVTKLSLL